MLCKLFMLAVLGVCVIQSAHFKDATIKEYDVQALEGGKIVREEIVIDLEKGLEAIDMPAHNGLDAVLTINDFKKEWTVRAMTEKETCYIMPLEDIFQEPKVLARAMESGDQGIWINTKNISFTYTVLGRVITNNLNFLPTYAQEVCADWPVYYVQRVEEQTYHVNKHGLHVKNMKPVGTLQDSKRQKRSIETCPYDLIESACKFVNRFCHYIKTCKRSYNPATQQDEAVCGDKQHKFGKNECCRRCCAESEYAGASSPYCAELTEADVDCANPVVEVFEP